MSLVKITDLSKKFRDNVVLDSIDLDVKKGDVIAVIGPSGTGKSTLLRCIDMLEKPDKGLIEFGDFRFDVTSRNKKDIVALRQRVGMVFQTFNLFKQKTVLENVMEGLIVVKKVPKAEAEAKALQYLGKVGMLDRQQYYPRQLSGGQQQRVAIARALAMEPELLLLDEPTSALDPELVGEVLDTILKAAEAGNTMILVSHEMSFVRKVASRVIFLENGHILEDGTPRQVFENPQHSRTKEFLHKFYLQEGPEFVI